MNNLIKQTCSRIPICTFISTVLIVIFLLTIINLIKYYPCNQNMLSNFLSNFFHTDMLHLLSNLYGLYVLSRVEKNIGPVKFMIVVSIILVLNTVLETIANNLYKTPCSIGFSSILYGILTWEIISGNKDANYYIIAAAIVFDALTSRYLNKKIAIVSHLLGILTGFILGLILKFK